ncbi:MAG: phosphoribosyl-AMP cyclohydrolase [Fimbriimonadaceae bacterium]|nr:phosphoribosyl-AMP cyclohydrolase [Alphaproteobacteria bacterium]
MDEFVFPRLDSKRKIETGLIFSPKFDESGLIPCVACDADTSEVLMLAYMNAEALARTIESGEAHYWSRSRGELWHKGATSGSVQRIVEMRTDCDQDAILIKVRVGDTGASCHLGYRSCFYRTVALGDPAAAVLKFEEKAPLAEPSDLYKKPD